jgi:hypothetical protein
MLEIGKSGSMSGVEETGRGCDSARGQAKVNPRNRLRQTLAVPRLPPTLHCSEPLTARRAQAWPVNCAPRPASGPVPSLNVEVRREGARNQRVKVPPEEEVGHLGSNLAGTAGDRWTRSPETKASKGG